MRPKEAIHSIKRDKEGGECLPIRSRGWWWFFTFFLFAEKKTWNEEKKLN